MRGKKGIRIHALDFFILKKGDPHSYPHTLLLRLCVFLICVCIVFSRANGRYKSSRSAYPSVSINLFYNCVQDRELEIQLFENRLLKSNQRIKILELLLSDTRAKNDQVYVQKNKKSKNSRGRSLWHSRQECPGTKRGREVSNLAAMCAFSYVPRKVTTCSLLRRRWQQNFAIILKI